MDFGLGLDMNRLNFAIAAEVNGSSGPVDADSVDDLLKPNVAAGQAVLHFGEAELRMRINHRQ